MMTIKRGIFQFNGINNFFRISKPGISVDTATTDQLILDERVFYGQLYAAGFLSFSNPAVPSDETVFFSTLAFAPIAICFPVISSRIVWPSKYFYSTGLGGSIVGGTTYYTQTDRLVYHTPGDGATTGFYYLIFRRGL